MSKGTRATRAGSLQSNPEKRWIQIGGGALDRADLVVRAGIMRLAQPLRKPNRGCLSGSGGGEKGGRPGNSGVSALSGRSRAASIHRRTISPFLHDAAREHRRRLATSGDDGGGCACQAIWLRPGG